MVSEICFIDMYPRLHRLLLEEKLPHGDLSLHIGDPERDALSDVIGDSRVIICGHTALSSDILERCPRLETIVFLGTGAGSYIDLPAAQRLGIAVNTIKGYGNRSIAEHTFALIFAAARRVCEMHEGIRNGRWQPLPGLQLAGSTLGVIGAGGIGREVIKIGRALGMRVLVWNASPLPAGLGIENSSLDELLEQADILTLHLAYVPATRHFLNAERLEKLKSGVIVVNTARAQLVDSAAMIDLLNRGHIAHAALDVYEEEPLPVGNAYRQLANVTLSAHSAYNTRAANLNLLTEGLRLARHALIRETDA